ncbi:gamma-glutamylaminecyclotransferase-like [Eucyclogobius newberryi]|uniref:gamma-glutamylaminecyclotransferase-like n=1 Tax=Eucyclogobius newberryi TaxID=166745 RepID=UPI003B59467B
MARVFVYGTLKKGQPNSHHMFEDSNGKAMFLGSAKTMDKFPLVIAGPHNIPYLLNIPGQGHRIHGEIYQVDEQMLKFLDALESVPTHYQRTLKQLEVKEWATPAPGSTTEATPAPGSTTEATPAPGSTTEATPAPGSTTEATPAPGSTTEATPAPGSTTEATPAPGSTTEATPAPGSTTEAWLYSTNTYNPDWTTLPTYESYDAHGDHGLKYVEREARLH